MEDQYLWRAQYADGRVINQIDADGTKHAYDELDREQLAAFSLIHKDTGEIALNIGLTDSDEARLFMWTRRTRTQDFKVFTYVHLVAIEGKYVSLLFPDGSVATQTRFSDEEASLFAPVSQEVK